MSTYDIFTGFLPQLLYRQFFVTPSVPSTDCTGKTVIVTGANVGLGKEAARHFARLGAEKVIIACRSVDKGEAAKRDIETSTARTGVVEVWKLDLQDYGSVKAFAKRADGLKRLDVVLENAGISTQKYVEVGGYESTITVNVVSTFLLALLVLPKLQETAKVHGTTPNLTIVSSEMHFVVPFTERKSSNIFATLNDPKQADMGLRYPLSKFLEVLACREITREHLASDLRVTLNFANPGWCHSQLMREMSGRIIEIIMNIFCRTTEVGSRPLVYAALAGPDTHGKYISDNQIQPCAPLVEGSQGPEMQRRVWQELKNLLDQIEPGVTDVLDA